MPELAVLLLTVPTITAAIGWGTNWAAVKMIFHPRRFVGIAPLGWQGILYKQVDKFAAGVADMVTENLISPRDLAERLDPEEVERLFAETLDRETAEICREAAEVIRPGSWDVLAEPARQMIVAQVRLEGRSLVREIFDRLQGISDELLDLHRLVRDQLSGENAGRLARLTRKIGRAEFKFIEYYGGVFGLMVGLLQVGVWQAMQTWWLMPMVGAFVGLGTNWLAIQMIFRPQEPRRYLGLVTYQGLFAKRQPEIARDYGEVSAAEILTPRNAIRLLTEGEAGARIARIVSQALSDKMRAEWKKVEALVPAELAADPPIEEVQRILVRRLGETAPEIQPALEAYLERKLDIAHTVETRLAALPKRDFERILRGIFEEDETTLILVGGFLGGTVGTLQGMLVLALGS
jgi:uncharacterized membrane protein YheB (UPF0754 family)